MKLRKANLKQILKLNFLKLKTHKPISDNINKTVNSIKNFLHIIFQYTKRQKRILFIGLPKPIEVYINKTTNHFSVPSNFDIKKLLYPKKIFNSTLQIVKLSFNEVDLIVLFDHKKENLILNENLKLKIPLIVFSEIKCNNKTLNFFYTVELDKKLLNLNKNIFFIFLKCILKS
jgi:ribosomal protein S2